MSDSHARKRRIIREEYGRNPELIALYQGLPIEQCIELYLQQKANLNPTLRTHVKLIIASKAIYGENYKPNLGKWSQDQNNT